VWIRLVGVINYQRYAICHQLTNFINSFFQVAYALLESLWSERNFIKAISIAVINDTKKQNVNFQIISYILVSLQKFKKLRPTCGGSCSDNMFESPCGINLKQQNIKDPFWDRSINATLKKDWVKYKNNKRYCNICWICNRGSKPFQACGPIDKQTEVCGPRVQLLQCNNCYTCTEQK